MVRTNILYEHQVNLLVTLAFASWAPSKTRGKKIKIRGNFRVKKVRETPFLGLREDQMYLFASWTKRSCKSFTCTRWMYSFSCLGTVYGNEIFWNPRNRHVERRPDFFTCVTCKKVCQICSEGPKRCFKRFVPSRNCLCPIFILVSLVLFLRQFERNTLV